MASKWLQNGRCKKLRTFSTCQRCAPGNCPEIDANSYTETVLMKGAPLSMIQQNPKINLSVFLCSMIKVFPFTSMHSNSDVIVTNVVR